MSGFVFSISVCIHKLAVQGFVDWSLQCSGNFVLKMCLAMSGISDAVMSMSAFYTLKSELNKTCFEHHSMMTEADLYFKQL